MSLFIFTQFNQNFKKNEKWLNLEGMGLMVNTSSVLSEALEKLIDNNIDLTPFISKTGELHIDRLNRKLLDESIIDEDTYRSIEEVLKK